MKEQFIDEVMGLVEVVASDTFPERMKARAAIRAKLREVGEQLKQTQEAAETYIDDIHRLQSGAKPLGDNEVELLCRRYLSVSEIDGYSIHGSTELVRAVEQHHRIGAK